MSIRSFVWMMLNPILLKCTRSESARQFFEMKPQEQKNLLENLSLCYEMKDKDGKIYRKWTYYFNAVREHFQLPCSVQTRIDRVTFFESHCEKDDKILLLGDDDLVSWELSQRRFTEVTASDCDQRLLDQIDGLCRKLTVRPRLVPGDFSDRQFNPGVEPDLVCIDPPYNVKWAEIFLRKALQTVENKGDAKLVMMVNPHCFSESDWEKVMKRIEFAGFDLVEHRERFNRYPLRGLSHILLRVSLIVMGLNKWRKGGRYYFSSDLFLFKKNRGAQGKLGLLAEQEIDVEGGAIERNRFYPLLAGRN
jgi:predicted methyltransferase